MATVVLAVLALIIEVPLMAALINVKRFDSSQLFPVMLFATPASLLILASLLLAISDLPPKASAWPPSRSMLALMIDIPGVLVLVVVAWRLFTESGSGLFTK